MQPTAFRDAALSRRGSVSIGLDRLGKFWHLAPALLLDDRKAFLWCATVFVRTLSPHDRLEHKVWHVRKLY